MGIIYVSSEGSPGSVLFAADVMTFTTLTWVCTQLVIVKETHAIALHCRLSPYKHAIAQTESVRPQVTGTTGVRDGHSKLLMMCERVTTTTATTTIKTQRNERRRREAEMYASERRSAKDRTRLVIRSRGGRSGM